jgi:hypothetical protein
MVHHLGVVAGLDHSMKSKDDDASTVSSGRSATVAAVEAPPKTAAKREFRLPRNSLDKELAEYLVAQAREDGVNLVGPDGLVSGIVGQLLETALEVEMSEHLGYERTNAARRRTAATAHRRRPCRAMSAR